MNKFLTLIFIIALITIGHAPLTSAQVQPQAPKFHGTEKVAEHQDNIIVNAELPYYSIHIIPATLTEKADCEDYLGRIEISVDDKITQILEIEGSARLELFSNSLSYPDINFDGYRDIAVVVEFGAKWTTSRFFIFDPITQQFVLNELSDQLEQIGSNELYIDNDKQEIYVTYLGPCCPEIDTYQIVNNNLVLVEKRQAVYQVNADNTATITYTIDHFIDNSPNNPIRVKTWSATVEPLEDGLWTLTELEEKHPELLK